MAILEPKIYTLLTNDADVSALVSTRVYPVKIPQNPTYPLISYQRISGGQVNSVDGYSDFQIARVQIDCYASTYTSVKDLADKVLTAMDGSGTFSASLESDNDIYEIEVEVYRVSMDFYISHYTA